MAPEPAAAQPTPARFGAVLNAASGTWAGGSGRSREELAERLAGLVPRQRIRWTEGASAADDARRLLEAGADALLAGGGDGTISAVAGVAAAAQAPLVVLPLGTRNHFARDLGIPTALPEALEAIGAIGAIGRMRRRRIDLGEVNGRTFINNVSLGLYPELVAQREKSQRLHGWKKRSAQILAAWRVLRRFPASRLAVEIEGRRISRRTPILLIGNNAYDGGLLADRQRPALDSGRLWLCMARSEGLGGLLRACWGFITGTLEELPVVDTRLVEALTVHARKKSVRLAIDGEATRMATPLRFRSLPGALEVFAP